MTATAVLIVGGYLSLLIFLGWRGHRRNTPGSLADFYLAGSNLGFVILLATLYASQYSGNTFLGYTGQAYRVGFSWIMCVGMMMSVVLVYLTFAPPLHVLAHRHGYVTPADFIRHRFGDRRLAALISLIMAFGLLNYLYAQFLAMGHLAVGISNGQVPFWAGVVVLGVVIGVYETLGGMRSVAWTDLVQGVLLLGGLCVVLALVWARVGSLSEITARLAADRPAMVAVPGWAQCAGWASSMLLMGVGAAVYPHALQRIYAARDSRTLQRSLRVMVCMPLLTSTAAVAIGILAHGLIAERSGIDADRIMAEVLAVVAADGAFGEVVSVLVLTAVLAAIMSTADSSLLSLSSMVVRDLIGELRPDLSEDRLARAGKMASWLIIGAVVLLAIRPPATLWRLIEIKMELLIQVAPAIILGVRFPELDARTVYTAALVGAALALAAIFAGIQSVGGVHAGTLAFVVNAAICAYGIRRARADRATAARFQARPAV
jgi:SSS family solute:Na+ symporter/sodium/pantothenate symporter